MSITWKMLMTFNVVVPRGGIIDHKTISLTNPELYKRGIIAASFCGPQGSIYIRLFFKRLHFLFRDTRCKLRMMTVPCLYPGCRFHG